MRGETYFNRGLLKHSLGNIQSTIQDFIMAAKLKPEDAKYHNALGYIQFETGNVDDAIDQLNKALEIAPNDPNNYDSRCEIYLKSGQLALGLADCDKAASMGWTFSDELQALREDAKTKLAQTQTPTGTLPTVTKTP